jgi:hypothetical protein
MELIAWPTSRMRTLFSMRVTAGRRAVSLLCLSLFVFLQALAAAPVWHRSFHHDAGHQDHHCAVTLLTQGKFHLTCGVIALPPASDFTTSTFPPPTSAADEIDFRLLPARAPPSLLS